MIGIYHTPHGETATEPSDEINAVVSRVADMANLTPDQCAKLKRWCFLNMGFDENGLQTYCAIDYPHPLIINKVMA